MKSLGDLTRIEEKIKGLLAATFVRRTRLKAPDQGAKELQIIGG